MMNITSLFALQRERITRNQTLAQDIRKARFVQPAAELPADDRDSTGTTYQIPTPNAIKAGYAANKILYV